MQSQDVEIFDEAVMLIHDWFSGSAVTHDSMFTIHALRAGHHVILSEEEFTMLIQHVLAYQPIEVIEKDIRNIDAEQNPLAYFNTLQD